MIAASRFVANKQYFPQGWLRARRGGVTATQVAKAATPAGFKQAVVDYFEDFVEFENAYMTFGKEMEPVISRTVHTEFGILPNEWLIRNDKYPHHLATPDGLSPDHTLISEVKTTGLDWDKKSLPIQYRRQVQWQLHVTGAERCLFAYMLRLEEQGVFAPAWFEPKSLWIERDEAMIDALISTANRLWERVTDG
jgi:predicted phage-related endonuclease